MNYVIDCSFSSALFLPDEKSEYVRSFFLNLKKQDQVFIPLLWWYETNNVLNVSVKRKRLKQAEVENILELVHKLKIETDSEMGLVFSKRIFEISQLHSLSSYDSVYVELAIRKKAKLMTLDRELADAARVIGIAVE
ncbi:MAG: twitching motility protein PilT [Spirochaetae bacterium HGW-Spirochaetae-1]|jgi:predicted nucleic acid-binding protein|nr:MAG: twitching motility protein PilT [Spirochaetae bacterium HGW-Spirochaetae-1]